MEKAFWAKRIADKFHGGEAKIDAAVAALMDVVTEIQQAQGDLDVSAVASNPAMAKVMESILHLQEARTDIVSAHRRIEQLGKELGIRTTAVGFIYKGVDQAERVVASSDLEAHG